MDRVARRIRAFRQWAASLKRADAQLLLSVLAFLCCVSVFLWVAVQVTGTRTQQLDEKVIRALRVAGQTSRPWGPAWVPGAVRDLTSLGSAPVLIVFVLAVGGALLARRQYHALILLLVAMAGGEGMNALLKGFFERPRPELALRLTEVSSTSFPSGHAMDSAVIYLTLAALLSRLVKERALKLYFLGLALLLTVVVGLTRVYLGVHYPSDVLAGWIDGLAWALLCWAVASYLQQRGSVEKAD
jgi:undecaprenyl-diphosphatase